MGRKKIVKEKELLAAIADSRGFYAVIAERLGVAWATVKSAIEESSAAQLAIKAEEEKMLDFVGGGAIARIKADDDAILDPFGGSGTTIIACEKLNRTAYVNEIDPHYCDVIRRRWTKWAEENGVNAGTGALK